MDVPTVSVLVPTYNRHELLVDTLRGLLIQDHRPMEIIVYDQSPSHPPEVESFLAQVSAQIQLHKGKPQGLVRAYLRCVELATGDICLFVDDDVLITDRRFVGRHAIHYQDDQIGAVAGQILHQGQKRPREVSKKVRSRHGWRHVRFDIDTQVDEMPSVGAGNMSFRRCAYESIGGFDPQYEGNGFRFETDFTFALRAAGKRVVFDPSASLIHRYRSPGGADNRYLGSLAPESHRWYVNFFANSWYFLLKWYSLPEAAYLMGTLWREHAFNRAAIGAGGKFLRQRQGAFVTGLGRGWRAWARWRRQSR